MIGQEFKSHFGRIKLQLVKIELLCDILLFVGVVRGEKGKEKERDREEEEEEEEDVNTKTLDAGRLGGQARGNTKIEREDFMKVIGKAQGVPQGVT